MQSALNDKEIIIAVIYTFTAIMVMAFSVLIFIYFTRRKILRKEIEQKQLELDYQKKLLQATLLTQEEERNRIAQDLHDDISSKLNIIGLNAHLLSVPDLSKAEFEKITSNIITVTSVVLEHSRRIAHDLLPPILDKFGLHAALEELCHSHENVHLNITYDNAGKQAFFEDSDIKNHLHIFRIIQELINNSVRHGKATQIAIVTKKAQKCRYIYYTDNGSGFTTNEIHTKSGIGMKNIESRVAFLGGEFEIKRGRNRGVKATLSF